MKHSPGCHRISDSLGLFCSLLFNLLLFCSYKGLLIVEAGFINMLIIVIIMITDSKGNPRCITNSKGKRRRPNSRDLASMLRVNDMQFVDFIRRCLE